MSYTLLFLFSVLYNYFFYKEAVSLYKLHVLIYQSQQ